MNTQMSGHLEKLFSPHHLLVYSKGNTLEGPKINTEGQGAEYLFRANFQDTSLRIVVSILQ